MPLLTMWLSLYLTGLIMQPTLHNFPIDHSEYHMPKYDVIISPIIMTEFLKMI